MQPFADKEPQLQSLRLFIFILTRPSGTPTLNFSGSEFQPDRFLALRLLYALTVASAAQELVPAL